MSCSPWSRRVGHDLITFTFTCQALINYCILLLKQNHERVLLNTFTLWTKIDQVIVFPLKFLWLKVWVKDEWAPTVKPQCWVWQYGGGGSWVAKSCPTLETPWTVAHQNITLNGWHHWLNQTIRTWTQKKNLQLKKKKKKFLMYLQTSLNQKAKETSAITLNLLAAVYHYYSWDLPIISKLWAIWS